MKASKFRRLVNKHFTPRVKELGWVGNGFDYRKEEKNHVVKLFGMYGSWTGGCIYCETGVHFDFLPIYGQEKPIEKKKVTECLFRKRLSVGTWEFYTEEERNIKQIESILDTFLKVGPEFYSDFANFPFPFDKISVEDVKGNPDFKLLGKYEIFNSRRFALLMKDINLYLGNMEVARGFSEYGIAQSKALAKKLLVGRKTKTYRLTEESIKIEMENLRIK